MHWGILVVCNTSLMKSKDTIPKVVPSWNWHPVQNWADLIQLTWPWQKNAQWSWLVNRLILAQTNGQKASTSWFLWGLQDHLLGWNRMKRIWNRIVITVITHVCIRNDLWHWVYNITGATLFLQGIFSHHTWLNSMTPGTRQNASDVWRPKTHGQNLAKHFPAMW